MDAIGVAHVHCRMRVVAAAVVQSEFLIGVVERIYKCIPFNTFQSYKNILRFFFIRRMGSALRFVVNNVTVLLRTKITKESQFILYRCEHTLLWPVWPLALTNPQPHSIINCGPFRFVHTRPHIGKLNTYMRSANGERIQFNYRHFIILFYYVVCLLLHASSSSSLATSHIMSVSDI